MVENLPRKRFRRKDILFAPLLTLFFWGGLVSVGEPAEKYPDRPINMVVPWGQGGAGDFGSKVVAERIGEFLGQPLISVYKPGGGGSLGASFVAKAKPDGYTILVGNLSAHVLPPIIKKLDYKLDDFIPVGIYGSAPLWLAVKADARWKTLKEFIDEEKKSPGKLKVGSYGKLTTVHFIIELLNKQARINLTHIPFKSTGEALAQVIGGHIDSGMVSGAGGLLEAGSVRILAVAEEKRLDGLADVPTFIECGYPIVISPRYSFCFPKGTPKEIVATFSQAQDKAFKKYAKEIKDGLSRVEIWADFLSYEDTVQYYKKQYEFLYKLSEELGFLAK